MSNTDLNDAARLIAKQLLDDCRIAAQRVAESAEPLLVALSPRLSASASDTTQKLLDRDSIEAVRMVGNTVLRVLDRMVYDAIEQRAILVADMEGET